MRILQCLDDFMILFIFMECVFLFVLVSNIVGLKQLMHRRLIRLFLAESTRQLLYSIFDMRMGRK